jgi:hypothetical protein
MRKSYLLAAATTALMLCAGAAQAAVAFSIGIGGPRVGAVITSGPVYAPAYAAPAYVAPAYAAPAYVVPAPVVYRPYYYGPRYVRPVVYPRYWARGGYYRPYYGRAVVRAVPPVRHHY